jgi:phytanoyl-CoA hydroxylase
MTALPRFPAPADGAPAADMRAAFARDGVLVLEGFADVASCDALIARANELVDAFEPGDAATVFSTTTDAHAQDAYFVESGDKIRFFFEEEAFDDAGHLRQAKALSVNKIGHALHDLDPAFDRFSRDPRLAALTRGLGVAEPLLLQSMYIFKQPHIGGEVVCHQDATFLRTEPPSVIGLWFALEDATLENGCLWAIPGGHKGPIKSVFRRSANGLVTDTLDPSPWPEDARVPIEAPRGTLVVLHGKLPHLSSANRSPRSRHAYTLHVIDGRCAYAADNWLQRGHEMPLRGF